MLEILGDSLYVTLDNGQVLNAGEVSSGNNTSNQSNGLAGHGSWNWTSVDTFFVVPNGIDF